MGVKWRPKYMHITPKIPSLISKWEGMLSLDHGSVWVLIASHRISLPLLISGGNLMFVFLPPGRVQSTERGRVGHHKPHSRREHWADCLRGAGWCYEASVWPAGCEGDQNRHSHSRCPHQHPQCEWRRGRTHTHTLEGRKITILVSWIFAPSCERSCQSSSGITVLCSVHSSCHPHRNKYLSLYHAGCNKDPTSGTGVSDDWRVWWTGQNWGSAAASQCGGLPSRSLYHRQVLLWCEWLAIIGVLLVASL